MTPLDPAAVFEAVSGQARGPWSGVACSILEPLIRHAENAGSYVPAHVEGEAIALAAGSWLAGRPGVALMQNSGLGNTVNPVLSLLRPYRIPATLMVSWRGEPGTKDASHHEAMGAAMEPLLELMGVRVHRLREATPDFVAQATSSAMEGRQLLAWVVSRGAFGEVSPRATPARPVFVPSARIAEFTGGKRPSRRRVVAEFTRALGSTPTISTTGYTSRELGSDGPRDHHFYMQGSMGFALGIALGVSITRPDRDLAVLDGDGAVLMRLGSLATAGALSPRRLIHIVLDNGTYGSTGAQPTSAPSVDLAAVAAACSYRRVARCCGEDSLEDALRWAREGLGEGPVFLHVRITAEEPARPERPERSPTDIADAFRSHLGSSEA